MQRSAPPLIALLAGIMLVCPIAAQAPLPGKKPFVQYDEKPARYLKRLHRKGIEESPAARFSFREDYPGGFAAWQKDAREKLGELVGLDPNCAG